jgi:hypothetical protein
MSTKALENDIVALKLALAHQTGKLEQVNRDLAELRAAKDEAREAMLEPDSMERNNRCSMWLKAHPKESHEKDIPS